MSRWTVLAILLGWFVIGDLLGGMAASRFDLGDYGELAVEWTLFALAAALLFPRIR